MVNFTHIIIFLNEYPDDQNHLFILIVSECSEDRAKAVVAVHTAIRVVEVEGASTPAIVPIAATIEPWIACCELQFNPYISYRLIEIPFFITITPL